MLGHDGRSTFRQFNKLYIYVSQHTSLRTSYHTESRFNHCIRYINQHTSILKTWSSTISTQLR